MLKIEYPEIAYPKKTIARAARNPMNSWALSDTTDEAFGPKDLMLMSSLARSGSDHAKYRRMMIVYLDIIAPLYWWKQFDTYKVGSVRVSCSTMHKITSKEFTPEDFSVEHLISMQDFDEPDPALAAVDVDGNTAYYSPQGFIKMTCDMLNNFREKYLVAKKIDSIVDDIKPKAKKLWWWQIIQLLPSSYNQKASIMLNYEVLSKIYHERRNHKLDEWKTFCDWIETLPYAKEVILVGKSE